MYYVYIWKKPGNIPFYIGIGRTKNRWNPLYAKTRNPHCYHTVLQIGVNNIIIDLIEVSSKDKAARIEQTLIWYYGRSDLGLGPLTNMTDGGDGIQNISEESKKRMSESAIKQKNIRSNRIKGSKNPMKNPKIYAHAVNRMNTPEVLQKYSGNNNPAKRPEVREKLLAKWQDPEYREKQRLNKLGKKIHSDEEKERRRLKLLEPNNPMREYHKVLNTDPEIKAKRVATLRSPEVQAKISAGLKAAWAKRKSLI
jgi:hypothetical protein